MYASGSLPSSMPASIPPSAARAAAASRAAAVTGIDEHRHGDARPGAGGGRGRDMGGPAVARLEALAVAERGERRQRRDEYGHDGHGGAPAEAPSQRLPLRGCRAVAHPLAS